MRGILIALGCLLALTSPGLADTGNIIVNGDFEDGLNGWSIAGPGKPAYIYNDPPLTPQVFNDFMPVNVMDYTGAVLGQTFAYAKTGNSVGWFRAGVPTSVPNNTLPQGMLYSFIYQDIYVFPHEEYTILQATWDCVSWDGSNQAKNDVRHVAGMFLIRIDNQIDIIYNPDDPSTYKFRSTTWNLDVQGQLDGASADAGNEIHQHHRAHSGAAALPGRHQQPQYQLESERVSLCRLRQPGHPPGQTHRARARQHAGSGRRSAFDGHPYGPPKTIAVLPGQECREERAAPPGRPFLVHIGSMESCFRPETATPQLLGSAGLCFRNTPVE